MQEENSNSLWLIIAVAVALSCLFAIIFTRCTLFIKKSANNKIKEEKSPMSMSMEMVERDNVT